MSGLERDARGTSGVVGLGSGGGGSAHARRLRFAAALVALCGSAIWVGACADLVDIEHGVCGNGVLDPGEDCDGAADASGAPCAPPEADDACRFTCAAGAVCPTGYACSADGVCVRPSEKFVSTTLFDSLGGDSLAVGDLDGDGINDVAVVSRGAQELAVEFMAPRLVPADEQRLPAAPTSAMTVGPVNSDAQSDLILGSQGSLGALTAAGGRRELVGTAFAPYTFNQEVLRVLAAPARASAVPPELPETVTVLEPDADSEGVVIGQGTSTQLFLLNPYTATTVFPGAFAIDVHRLLPPLRAAVLDRSGKDACDEIVLPFRADGADGGKVGIFPLCDLESQAAYPEHTGDCTGTPPVGLVCPALVEVGGDDVAGVFPVEVDGDPAQELVVLLGTKNAPTGLAVMEESGPGFALTEPLPPSVALVEDLILSSSFSGGVLLVRDLNGDGQVDVIGTQGAYLSKSDGGGSFEFYRAAAPLAGADWAEAAVADFNGDGRLDFVATPTSATDVDLLLGSSGSYYNPAVLATGGQAAVVVSGDFDGDGLGDVAMRERTQNTGEGTPKCTDLDDLVIRFGQPSGLGERNVVARAAGIEQTQVGRLPRLDKRDSIQDFGVALHCDAGDGQVVSRASVFYGALDRQVAAPFLLQDQLDDADLVTSPPYVIPFQPRATAAGSVESTRLVAAIATSIAAFRPQSTPAGYPSASDVGLFVLETGEDGVVFGTEHIVPISLELAGLSATSDLALLEDGAFHLALGDVDGATTQASDLEVVVTIGSQLLVARNWASYPSESEKSSLESAPDDVTATPLPGPAVDLQLVDLDGDGATDIVVAGDAVPAQGEDVGAPYLIVFYGGANPASVPFDLGGDRVVALGALPSYEGATDAVPTRVDLAVVSGPALNAQTVKRYRVGADRALGAPTVLGASTYTTVTDLAVADVDGDHFEDLVLTTPTATHAIVRQPVLAGDGQ